MCDPNVTLEMVTDPSGKFRRISVEDVIVGDLVYMVPNVELREMSRGVMCAKILDKTSDDLKFTHSINTDPQDRYYSEMTASFDFINRHLELYMELDYRKPREALLRLEAGTQLSDDHIQRFLFDEMMMREYLSYIDADGFKRHSHSNTGGKKHNKKTRKTRKSRKSKTFKNIKYSRV
jgi:hypothetical protein